MLKLTELLFSFSQNRPQQVVALQNGQPKTRQDFLNQVAQGLDYLSACSARRWGLYLEDSFEFAAMFLACLHCGKEPIILPNAQPSFLEQLSSELDAVFTNQALASSGLAFGGAILESHCRLALFTSGSTGRPKKVVKTLEHLDAELATLERTWGEQTQGSISLSTVSHQHIYGLLFQVLWPLCSGRIFETEVFSYPSDLTERMTHFDKVVVVSSPAHLNRITKLTDLAPHRSRLAAAFSSGGALERTPALAFREASGQSVIEVFGSTETGGIAHRQQDSAPTSVRWNPFSVVEVQTQEQSSKLRLRSPYLDCDSWFLGEDRIRLLPCGRFELLGRADRVVKVEGKRVSLDEFEQHLGKSEYVEQARALLLTEGRTNVGIVLVPSKRGREMIDKEGLPELKMMLKEQLAGYFERVLLPRKWRVVEEMPVNSQGKLTQESLRTMFVPKKIEKPLVVSVQQNDDSVELLLSIRENTRYFDGHFPGHPVLPGIAQVDWAIEFAQQYFSIEGQFQALESLKFPEFIQPNAQVCLKLSYRPEKQKVIFSFHKDERKVSSGRMVFR